MAGAWLAVVDVPWLGVEAVAELGVPLERLVRVDPGESRAGATARVVGRARRRRPRRVRARHHPHAPRLNAAVAPAGPGQGAGPRGRADHGRRIPARCSPTSPWRPRRRCGRASSTGGGGCAGGGSPSRRPGGGSPGPAGPTCGCPAPTARWRTPASSSRSCRIARRGLIVSSAHTLPPPWRPAPPRAVGSAGGWSRCGVPTGRSSPPGRRPACRRSCCTPTASSPDPRPPPPRAWPSGSVAARPSGAVPTSCCSTTIPIVMPGRSSPWCGPSAGSRRGWRSSSRDGCASVPAARRATSVATDRSPSRSWRPSREIAGPTSSSAWASPTDASPRRWPPGGGSGRRGSWPPAGRRAFLAPLPVAWLRQRRRRRRRPRRPVRPPGPGPPRGAGGAAGG